jgi:ABC-2 type transport system ATP-binding protein
VVRPAVTVSTTTTATTTNSVVAAVGLQKSFGTVRAVGGISLAVERGETVALLGPNGAGKTTTIALLLGLLAPDEGTVSLFGGNPHDAVAAGRIGAMLQDGGLLPGVRVGELLHMLAGLYPSPLPVPRVLAMAQIESIADRRVDRLSGGQSQRLRVAAALIGNPELLVLDEPTAALDVEARRAFWATMRAETENGRTIVFSTHYLEEADDSADRVVVIGAGRVLADGTPTAIKASMGMRVLRCTVCSADDATLSGLPGVVAVEQRRGRVELRSRDSDATLRALLVAYPDVADIEIAGAGLEDAFLALTGSH